MPAVGLSLDISKLTMSRKLRDPYHCANIFPRYAVNPELLKISSALCAKRPLI
jgi:hypothetical protein